MSSWAVSALLFVSFAPRLAAQEVLVDAPRGDGRRTMGRFVPNLGRNFVGVFSGSNLKPFAIGLAAAGAGRLFDDAVKNHFQGRAEEFGEAGQSFGGVTVMAPLALTAFAAGRFTTDTRFRAATYDVGQAFVVTAAYTEILKRAASRTRPDLSNSKSFPSGHTSNAFALATVVNSHYGKKAGLAAYALAGLVGVSRIERDKHYLSDVVAGAALGVVVGRSVTRKDGEGIAGEKHFSLGPSFAPSGGGVGIGVSVDF